MPKQKNHFEIAEDPPTGEVRSVARRLMIQDGLLPTIDAREGQVNEALDKLSPEARRTSTRRFRKAWRLARKKQEILSEEPREPSPKEKRTLVHDWYLDQAHKQIPDRPRVQKIR